MQGPGADQSQQPGYTPQARVRFEAIGEAWRLFQEQMGTWVVAVLVYFAVSMVLSLLVRLVTGAVGGQPQVTPGNPIPTFGPAFFTIQSLGGLVQWAIGSFLAGGLFRMATMQLRGQPISVGDLFSVSDVLPSLLAASFLTALASFIGLLFCIIPGLVIGSLLMFTIPLIVDKRLGATEAMGQSWNALKGEAVMATLFYFVAALIGSVGALLCGIGMLITFPVFILSVAILYRDFFMGPTVSGSSVSPPGTYPPSPIPEPPMR